MQHLMLFGRSCFSGCVCASHGAVSYLVAETALCEDRAPKHGKTTWVEIRKAQCSQTMQTVCILSSFHLLCFWACCASVVKASQTELTYTSIKHKPRLTKQANAAMRAQNSSSRPSVFVACTNTVVLFCDSPAADLLDNIVPMKQPFQYSVVLGKLVLMKPIAVPAFSICLTIAVWWWGIHQQNQHLPLLLHAARQGTWGHTLLTWLFGDCVDIQLLLHLLNSHPFETRQLTL
jgi:hypothetical protein